MHTHTQPRLSPPANRQQAWFNRQLVPVQMNARICRISCHMSFIHAVFETNLKWWYALKRPSSEPGLTMYIRSVTAEYPPREAEKPAPHRPPPPRPAAPVAPSPPPAAAAAPNADTADFLNLNSSTQPPPPETKPKKLTSDDSFDFFGMMEKPAEEGFGDFLSGKVTENTRVCSRITIYGWLNRLC